MLYNSTIRVKKRPCKSCGRDSIIFSRGRCAQCAKVEDFHAKEEALQKEEDGLPELIDRLDALVSRWVRYSAMGFDGLVQCYTCHVRLPPSEMDAGHYLSRSILYLRFDVVRNIRPQCRVCNRSKYGKAAVFGQNLEKELLGVTELLLEESRIVFKYSREELRALISEFTEKVMKCQVHGKTE